jgi:hypothetical protein
MPDIDDEKVPTRMIWFEALGESYDPQTNVWVPDAGPHAAVPREITADNHTAARDPATGDIYYAAWDINDADDDRLDSYIIRYRDGSRGEAFAPNPMALREHSMRVLGDSLYVYGGSIDCGHDAATSNRNVYRINIRAPRLWEIAGIFPLARQVMVTSVGIWAIDVWGDVWMASLDGDMRAIRGAARKRLQLGAIVEWDFVKS